MKRLVIQRKEANEIVVESFTATEWEDFVIVRIDNFDEDSFPMLLEALSERAGPKKYIVIDKDMDIDFYGVQVNEEAADN